MRQMSITTDEVSWEAHSNWYNNSLKNTNRYLYVGIIEMFCVIKKANEINVKS